MRYCQNCGTKLDEGQDFCPNCGAKAAAVAPAYQGVMPSGTEGMPAKATGGLLVWLWIMIVAGIISAIYAVILAYVLSPFGGKYILLMLVSAALSLVAIYGEYRLMKGYKLGFYIICIVDVVSIIVSLILVPNWYNAVFALASPIIVWVLARKQWTYFR